MIFYRCRCGLFCFFSASLDEVPACELVVVSSADVAATVVVVVGTSVDVSATVSPFNAAVARATMSAVFFCSLFAVVTKSV